MRCIKWIPDGPRWLLQQRHTSLIGGPIGLAGVTVDAGQHAVRPAGQTASRPWNDVVDGQLFANRLLAAVLTRESVSLEDVPATECHGIRRKPIVGRQYDDLRNTQPP